MLDSNSQFVAVLCSVWIETVFRLSDQEKAVECTIDPVKAAGWITAYIPSVSIVCMPGKSASSSKRAF